MSKPKLSIIIPCFNSQATLKETLESVVAQNFNEWEAIIVNDGSIDHTKDIAQEFVERDKRFRYFSKKNEGLAQTRNFGIEKAKGQYILLLDSDNLVRKDFARKASKILNENAEIGVVYGDAMYFGERQGIWRVGKFDKFKMLNHNYIDACAIIRKRVFDTIGYYDENLPHQGHEDWDFWLRAMAHNIEFLYLEVITFDYRVSSNSMIRSFNEKMMTENINFIKKKNCELYINEYHKLLKKIDLCNSEKERINKNVYFKFLRKLKLI